MHSKPPRRRVVIKRPCLQRTGVRCYLIPSVGALDRADDSFQTIRSIPIFSVGWYARIKKCRETFRLRRRVTRSRRDFHPIRGNFEVGREKLGGVVCFLGGLPASPRQRARGENRGSPRARRCCRRRRRRPALGTCGRGSAGKAPHRRPSLARSSHTEPGDWPPESGATPRAGPVGIGCVGVRGIFLTSEPVGTGVLRTTQIQEEISVLRDGRNVKRVLPDSRVILDDFVGLPLVKHYF